MEEIGSSTVLRLREKEVIICFSIVTPNHSAGVSVAVGWNPTSTSEGGSDVAGDMR